MTCGLYADTSSPVDEAQGASQVLNVTHLDKHKNDAGRVIDYSGKRHYDKFYQLESMVPEEEAGEAYVVKWMSDNAYENIMIKFEYMPVQSMKVFEKTIAIASVQKGIQQTIVEHRGAEYKEQGKIRSWHITVLHDNQILAEKKSAYWSERLTQ